MAILYEYHNEVTIQSPMALKTYLHQVWQEQFGAFTQDLLTENEEEESAIGRKKYQPFLQFDGATIRARNWVGFIQLDDLQLELYPKVFRRQPTSPILMLRHLFFWFDYCRKWKFPFTRVNLDHLEDAGLPELLICLMGSKMLEIVSSMPISLYHLIEEPLLTPTGSINFDRYLSTGFINGNQQLIDCDHEPFVFDNRLNRVIKYTTRVLLNKTVIPENQRILEELILFWMRSKTCPVIIQNWIPSLSILCLKSMKR
jgi:5-methylcytosine-specific restriction enzyme subunit McrC